jgi:hypothetical protein
VLDLSARGARCGAAWRRAGCPAPKLDPRPQQEFEKLEPFKGQRNIGYQKFASAKFFPDLFWKHQAANSTPTDWELYTCLAQKLRTNLN